MMQTAFSTSNTTNSPSILKGRKQGGSECSGKIGSGSGNDRRDDQPISTSWRYYCSCSCNFCLHQCQLLAHWRASIPTGWGLFVGEGRGTRGHNFWGNAGSGGIIGHVADQTQIDHQQTSMIQFFHCRRYIPGLSYRSAGHPIELLPPSYCR